MKIIKVKIQKKDGRFKTKLNRVDPQIIAKAVSERAEAKGQKNSIEREPPQISEQQAKEKSSHWATDLLLRAYARPTVMPSQAGSMGNTLQLLPATHKPLKRSIYKKI